MTNEEIKALIAELLERIATLEMYMRRHDVRLLKLEE